MLYVSPEVQFIRQTRIPLSCPVDFIYNDPVCAQYIDGFFTLIHNVCSLLFMSIFL